MFFVFFVRIFFCYYGKKLFFMCLIGWDVQIASMLYLRVFISGIEVQCVWVMSKPNNFSGSHFILIEHVAVKLLMHKYINDLILMTSYHNSSPTVWTSKHSRCLVWISFKFKLIRCKFESALQLSCYDFTSLKLTSWSCNYLVSTYFLFTAQTV